MTNHKVLQILGNKDRAIALLNEDIAVERQV